ncbi:MAG: hypothetical protein WC408_05970 [Candidatus Micrarchaeia archaeon]|jgi:hypothetical protein
MKRGEQHLESSIPLILIAILAVFVAAKFGFVNCSSIPGLNMVCPTASINVLVIGNPSSGIDSALQSEDFRMQGIVYQSNIHQSEVYPGVLNQVDIIVLQGEQTCDRTARKVIADKVKSGGKMVVIQDACTKLHDDTTLVGWSTDIGNLGDVMPVQIGSFTRENLPIKKTSVTGTFKIIPINHPIFPSGQKNYEFSSYVVKVLPSSTVDSEVLAYINIGDEDSTTGETYFAMLESKSLLSGKVIYFAYDPGTLIKEGKTRNLFLSTLLYLAGSKG